MRDGALLVNAGRGARGRHGGVLGELESGRLRAVLDVVDPEPLPDDHPLWGAVSRSRRTTRRNPAADERAMLFGAEQMARFARGEQLLNVVRRSRQAPSGQDP